MFLQSTKNCFYSYETFMFEHKKLTLAVILHNRLYATDFKNPLKDGSNKDLEDKKIRALVRLWHSMLQITPEPRMRRAVG
jgi:hypothetical protein